MYGNIHKSNSCLIDVVLTHVIIEIPSPLLLKLKSLQDRSVIVKSYSICIPVKVRMSLSL